VLDAKLVSDTSKKGGVVAENIRLGKEEEEALRRKGSGGNNNGYRGRGGRGGG
jgi:hypothetical protein